MIRLFYTVLVFLFAGLFAVSGCTGVSAGYEERGDRYYRNGYYDDSLAEYLMAEETRGPSAALLRKIGKVYVMKGDFYQAKKYFDRYFSAHDSEPDREVLLDYLQIAVHRGTAGDTTTMVHALEEIIDIDPDFGLGRYWFDLGDYYYQQAEYRTAISYYLEGISLDVQVDDRPRHLFQLAESYEKVEDHFNAFLYFDQFVTLYPEHQEIEQARWHRSVNSFPLAKEMFEKEEYDQAQYYIDQIIGSEQPQHLVDDAYYLEGEVLLAQNRPEEAKQSFREVLKLNRYYYTEKVAEQARQRIRDIEFNRRE